MHQGDKTNFKNFKNYFKNYFRIVRHFDNWMKKGAIIGGNSTDYTFSNECCVMVDVIIDCKAQVWK